MSRLPLSWAAAFAAQTYSHHFNAVQGGHPPMSIDTFTLSLKQGVLGVCIKPTAGILDLSTLSPASLTICDSLSWPL